MEDLKTTNGTFPSLRADGKAYVLNAQTVESSASNHIFLIHIEEEFGLLQDTFLPIGVA